MDIKLNARLSAYSKINSVVPEDCEHEIVSNEDIDSLFESTSFDSSSSDSTNSDTVSKSEIDKLFGGV